MTMSSFRDDTTDTPGAGRMTSLTETDSDKHQDDDNIDNDDNYRVGSMTRCGLMSSLSDQVATDAMSTRRRQQHQRQKRQLHPGRHSLSESLIGIFHNDNNRDSIPLTTCNDETQHDSEHRQPRHHHMKTYTAGEDNGRLAQAAKELGLAKSRQPREQIRKRQQIYWDGDEIISFTGNPRQFFHQNCSSKKADGTINTTTSSNPFTSMWRLLTSVVGEGRTEGAQMLALYSAHNVGDGNKRKEDNKSNEKCDVKSHFHHRHHQRNNTIPSPFLYNIQNNLNNGTISSRNSQHVDLLRLHRKQGNDYEDDIDTNNEISDCFSTRWNDPNRRSKFNSSNQNVTNRSQIRQSSTVPVVEIDSNNVKSNERKSTNDVDDDTFIGSSIGDGHDEIVGNGDLTSAMLATVRGMVGPAILYLPYGFANAGYVIALPLLATCTFFFLYSSDCLLDAWKYEHDKDYQSLYDNSNINTNNNSSSNNNICLGDEGISSCEQSPLLIGNSTTITKSTEPISLHNHQLGDTNPQQQKEMASNSKHSTENAMLSYPELAYRAFGIVGETCVKVGIASMQAGVCLTYLIFVPKNLHSSILYVFNTNIPPLVLLVGMIAVQIPLSWTRDIRKLTPTNLLANVLILYGLLVCLGYAIVRCCTTSVSDNLVHTEASNSNMIDNIRSHVYNLPPYQPNWILFIGTSVFLFEGSITLLIPLQESVVIDIYDDSGSPVTEEQRMEMRQAELLFPIVNRRVIVCIISFYTLFGLTCWMAYGDTVDVVMTTSLPESALATSVQLAYSIAVMFTFPLQNFPALEIITRSIMTQISLWNDSYHSKKSDHGQVKSTNLQKKRLQQQIQRNIISSCTVLVLAIIAVFTMDSLDMVVSLLGSLLGCPIAYILPPLIHTKLVLHKCTGYEKEQAQYRNRLYLNYAAIAFGLVAMIIASIITVLDWK